MTTFSELTEHIIGCGLSPTEQVVALYLAEQCALYGHWQGTPVDIAKSVGLPFVMRTTLWTLVGKGFFEVRLTGSWKVDDSSDPKAVDQSFNSLQWHFTLRQTDQDTK